MPSRADVVIVGAGYTGLSAARQLARAGASVAVIEREQVGWGASSRNGGQVLTGMKLEAAALVDRFGDARARQLFDLASTAIDRLERLIAEEAIECEYEQVGHLCAAFKPSHFDAFHREQELLARVFDHPVRVVPRPDQRTEIGSDAYHGVLVDDRSGALNPAEYVRGLADAAIRAGATITTGVGVTRIQRQPAGWRIQTTAGELDARDVLLAGNGYTDAASPALQRRFVPIGSYIIATEPLDADVAAALLPRRRMAFDSKHFLYYFRVTADRRLLFGGRAEFGRPDPDTTRRAAAILRQGMTTIFPELRETRIDYAWSGNVAFTRDQMPRAGRLGGQYYAGGYCGHGIAMATYLGEQIARRIAGEPIDDPLFDDQFPAIPMYSGDPWFLPLVGAYYRVKDWLQ
ncbi:MAG: dependent oxidoreductase [Acidobacteria bacterium]|nr:dependent oxidoreductase [Acidobacteriota bacterium]